MNGETTSATGQGPPLRVVCGVVDREGRDLRLSEEEIARILCNHHISMNDTRLRPVDAGCREFVFAPSLEESATGELSVDEKVDSPGALDDPFPVR